MANKTLIYQIYPRSFQGLAEIEDFLYQVAELGVDYVWLSPIFPSPGVDHGYDISDYIDIDPRFGDLRDFDNLVKTAHDLDIGMLLDYVFNHTSIKHPWFTIHPEYYCWSDTDRPGWQNLFNGSSAWQYYQKRGQYYLHLFHEQQADLNWFPDGPDGDINLGLVKQHQGIIDFWMLDHRVDGFRLDATQVINKDVRADQFDPFATVTTYRSLAARVINMLFANGPDAYLLTECLDLSGEMVKFYHEQTPVSATMDNTPINTLGITADRLATHSGLGDFVATVCANWAYCPEGYAHVTESHDGPRFTSSTGISGKEAIDILFGLYRGEQFCSPQTIVMYQGQELGLSNPTKEQLPDHKLVDLDAETAMRFRRGELLDDLRPTSRANARVRLPFEEYDRQKQDPHSCLNYTKEQIARWRAS